MKTYNWINSMNIGDQFLDETGKFIGTILFKDDSHFNWHWMNLKSNKIHSKFSDWSLIEDYHDAKIESIGWIKITPLIKELV